LVLQPASLQAAVIGGVDLGGLTDYLLYFSDGSGDANWQGASKGFVGDVGVFGTVADERTSGTVPYAGTIYTNDTTLDAWQDIVDDNSGQASGSTGQTTRIADLRTDLNAAFTAINALASNPPPGFSGGDPTTLNNLNTQNSICTTYVLNVTDLGSISSKINITGDACDVFVMRWDDDGNLSNGYDGQVKFQSGGAIVPLGGLLPSNFIHVAGDINASGGGSNPASPYPQGPRSNDGTGSLCSGCANFSGGGFFTGYWLTTGKPDNPADANHSVRYGNSSSLSNGIFVGGWYSINNKFSMTSGTSGVYVSPNPATEAELDFGDLPDTTSGTGAGNYQTLLANNGPRHTIGAIQLGAAVDNETNGQPNGTATGDDIAGATAYPPGDEAGVTLPQLTAGLTATVVVNSSAAGKLNAFFDWNNDGDFLDAGEAIAELTVAAGNNNLSVPVPANAVTGTGIGARFRVSTAGGLTALGAAPDGEVEDYLVTVNSIAADLRIEKFAIPSPDPAIVGGTLTYSLVVTNNGPDADPAVVVTDSLPPEVSFVSASATQGTCSEAGGTVTCTLGAMTASGTATVTIVTTVIASP
jgi:uncharacterized repeat protein (TIGR01451 family)